MSARHVFTKETDILNHCKGLAEKDNIETEDYKNEYKELCKNYEDLLVQGKLITKVSDRLQNKLNNANDALALKNFQLQDTIDELTKTKIGKKATTIVLILVVVLFLISEALDPLIETYTGHNLALGLIFKALIAILLKPLESFVESYMMKRVKEKKKFLLSTMQVKGR